ncbi:hypothetical protein ACFL2C_02785 [Patescibacteria group bacterium]
MKRKLRNLAPGIVYNLFLLFLLATFFSTPRIFPDYYLSHDFQDSVYGTETARETNVRGVTSAEAVSEGVVLSSRTISPRAQFVMSSLLKLSYVVVVSAIIYSIINRKRFKSKNLVIFGSVSYLVLATIIYSVLLTNSSG